MNSLIHFARRVAVGLAFSLALPVFFSAIVLVNPGVAQAAVASSIQVQGNQRIEAETIKTYLKIKPGKAYSAGDIDESVKVLYGTGLFSDVSIVQRGSVLVVTVVENPVINRVLFEGNDKVKSDTLSNIVDLKPRGVLTDAKLQSDVFHIKQYYQTTGRSSVQVDGRVTQLPDNRVDVTFAINEGERTGVAAINFVGNNAFTNSRLTGVIQTKTTNWLSWLSKNDIYSQEKLDADADLLRKFYLSHGYADFQVLSDEATFDQATGKYTVTFTLDEGPKYTYGNITIDSSIPGVDTAALEGIVRTKSGKTFDSRQLEKSTEALTIEMSRLGYVFAQVRPRGDRNYSSNTIDLTYVIDEGQRAYIERIDIRGNTRTRDYVIRREFDLSEGDAYNRVLINRAQRRLQDLDYFKVVNITTEPGSAPDKVVVVVYVEDKSTGSFSIAGGVATSSTGTGLIAEIGMEETNFLGRGQTVRVSLGGGLDDTTFNASFYDPYFLGNRVGFGISGYHTTSNGSSSRPFSTAQTGGAIAFTLPLTDAWTADVNYKINSADVSGAPACGLLDLSDGNPSPAGCFFPNGSRLTSSLGWGLTYSTLDSRLDPREGLYFRFTQDFAGVGGDARFVRTVADARIYRPIIEGGDYIGMLRAAGGNIIGIGQPVASIDNFFKGGETIRGFAPLGYGPRELNSGAAIGGKNFVAGTAEVQFPLPIMPPEFGLRGAVFADAGLLWGADVPATCGAFCNVADDTALRSSVGASIIWASPFGPIRADFAQALSKQSYDTTQSFRIGTGAAF
jgi:outer membrane protein insertion porin family